MVDGPVGAGEEGHVGDLVVVEKEGEGTEPVGIVTDRDIVIEVTAQKIDPDSLTVKDIMSTDPVSVPETTSLLDTLARLHSVHPVEVRQGDAVGGRNAGVQQQDQGGEAQQAGARESHSCSSTSGA